MTCRLRRRKKGKTTNPCQSQTDCLARKGKIANLCVISYFLPGLLLSTPFPLRFLSNERPERTENKKNIIDIVQLEGAESFLQYKTMKDLACGCVAGVFFSSRFAQKHPNMYT